MRWCFGANSIGRNMNKLYEAVQVSVNRQESRGAEIVKSQDYREWSLWRWARVRFLEYATLCNHRACSEVASRRTSFVLPLYISAGKSHRMVRFHDRLVARCVGIHPPYPLMSAVTRH
ncbi:hypothetical protein FRAAL4623 [Frankia alni ACN14a]|uniref:Uncharacterized protein n=1 Tax=Frankia alni (strain DSM 45986 / CECT 9034 / ACN14a) TaxID=326424 RepID=Q0RGX1_FRAAA|nr:hypothetical protein FRAAL4623 [Frankia alni ACN14a]